MTPASTECWPARPNMHGSEFRWFKDVLQMIVKAFEAVLEPNAPSWSLIPDQPKMVDTDALMQEEGLKWWGISDPNNELQLVAGLSDPLRYNMISLLFGGPEESQQTETPLHGRLTRSIESRLIQQWFSRVLPSCTVTDVDGPEAAFARPGATTALQSRIPIANHDRYRLLVACERSEAIRQSQMRQEVSAGRHPNSRLVSRLSQIPLTLSVQAGTSEISAVQLMNLKPGDTIRLADNEQMATILHDGVPLLRGRPVAVDGRLAVAIEKLYFNPGTVPATPLGETDERTGNPTHHT